MAGPHGDAPVVRVEAGQLHSPTHVDAELVRPPAEQPLDVLLRHESDLGGGPSVAEARLRTVDQVGAQHDSGEVPDEFETLARGNASVSAVPFTYECLEAVHRLPLHLGQRGQHAPAVERLGAGRGDRPALDRRVHFGEALQDGHPRAPEPELAGQHQSDRAASGHHYVIVHVVHGADYDPVPRKPKRHRSVKGPAHEKNGVGTVNAENH